MSLFRIRNLAPHLLSDMSCSDGLKVYPSSLWVDYMKEKNEKHEFYTLMQRLNSLYCFASHLSAQ